MQISHKGSKSNKKSATTKPSTSSKSSKKKKSSNSKHSGTLTKEEYLKEITGEDPLSRRLKKIASDGKITKDHLRVCTRCSQLGHTSKFCDNQHTATTALVNKVLKLAEIYRRYHNVGKKEQELEEGEVRSEGEKSTTSTGESVVEIASTKTKESKITHAPKNPLEPLITQLNKIAPNDKITMKHLQLCVNCGKVGHLGYSCPHVWKEVEMKKLQEMVKLIDQYKKEFKIKDDEVDKHKLGNLLRAPKYPEPVINGKDPLSLQITRLEFQHRQLTTTLWKDSIKNASNIETDSKIKEALQTLIKMNNISMKKEKFFNIVKNSLKNTSATFAQRLWNRIEKWFEILCGQKKISPIFKAIEAISHFCTNCAQIGHKSNTCNAPIYARANEEDITLMKELLKLYEEKLYIKQLRSKAFETSESSSSSSSRSHSPAHVEKVSIKKKKSPRKMPHALNGNNPLCEQLKKLAPNGKVKRSHLVLCMNCAKIGHLSSSCDAPENFLDKQLEVKLKEMTSLIRNYVSRIKNGELPSFYSDDENTYVDDEFIEISSESDDMTNLFEVMGPLDEDPFEAQLKELAPHGNITEKHLKLCVKCAKIGHLEENCPMKSKIWFTHASREKIEKMQKLIKEYKSLKLSPRKSKQTKKEEKPLKDLTISGISKFRFESFNWQLETIKSHGELTPEILIICENCSRIGHSENNCTNIRIIQRNAVHEMKFLLQLFLEQKSLSGKEKSYQLELNNLGILKTSATATTSSSTNEEGECSTSDSDFCEIIDNPTERPIKNISDDSQDKLEEYYEDHDMAFDESILTPPKKLEKITIRITNSLSSMGGELDSPEIQGASTSDNTLIEENQQETSSQPPVVSAPFKLEPFVEKIHALISEGNLGAIKICTNCAEFGHEDNECQVGKIDGVEEKIDQIYKLVQLYVSELEPISSPESQKEKNTNEEMEVMESILDPMDKEEKVDSGQEEMEIKNLLNNIVDLVDSTY